MSSFPAIMLPLSKSDVADVPANTLSAADSSFALQMPSTHTSKSLRLAKLLTQLPQINTAPPKPPTEFILFQKPPIELRLNIWKLTAYDPRQFRIRYRAPHAMDYAYLQLTAKVPKQLVQPGIMSACRESREEGKKYYEDVREKACGEDQQSVLSVHSYCGWWINFDVDRFILNLTDSIQPSLISHDGHNFEARDLAKVKHFKICTLAGLGSASSAVLATMLKRREKFYGSGLEEVAGGAETVVKVQTCEILLDDIESPWGGGDLEAQTIYKFRIEYFMQLMDWIKIPLKITDWDFELTFRGCQEELRDPLYFHSDVDSDVDTNSSVSDVEEVDDKSV